MFIWLLAHHRITKIEPRTTDCVRREDNASENLISISVCFVPLAERWKSLSISFFHEWCKKQRKTTLFRPFIFRRKHCQCGRFRLRCDDASVYFCLCLCASMWERHFAISMCRSSTFDINSIPAWTTLLMVELKWTIVNARSMSLSLTSKERFYFSKLSQRNCAVIQLWNDDDLVTANKLGCCFVFTHDDGNNDRCHFALFVCCFFLQQNETMQSQLSLMPMSTLPFVVSESD